MSYNNKSYKQRQEDFIFKLEELEGRFCDIDLDEFDEIEYEGVDEFLEVFRWIRIGTNIDEAANRIKRIKHDNATALYFYMISQLNWIAFDSPEKQVEILSEKLAFIKETLTKDSPLKDLYKELWSLEL